MSTSTLRFQRDYQRAKRPVTAHTGWYCSVGSDRSRSLDELFTGFLIHRRNCSVNVQGIKVSISTCPWSCCGREDDVLAS